MVLNIKVKEIETKTALHRLGKRMYPYNYDLNIYRGCSHKCVYCYALYSHKYFEKQGGFFDTIFVKKNILEPLEKKLSSSRWKKEVINFGGVCDSYQYIEKKYKLMPEILKLMIKYENPMIISTKSDLILRDIDLIKELAKKTYVNVAETITCMDEGLRKKIEPYGVSSLRRFEVLKIFREKTNAGIGVHCMPILPFLTDNQESLEALIKKTKEINAHYMITSGLNLIGDTKKHYYDFLKKEFPDLVSKYHQLFTNTQIKKGYNSKLYPLIKKLKYKYKVSSDYQKVIKEKLKVKDQLKMFE
jgi:DNA repair photolyase